MPHSLTPTLSRREREDAHWQSQWHTRFPSNSVGWCSVVVQVAAGELDEHIFQAGVACCQTGQFPIEILEMIEQRWYGYVRLVDRKAKAILFRPHGLH